MKHAESDVKRQISIQGIHLSAFWNYFWEREGSFILTISELIWMSTPDNNLPKHSHDFLAVPKIVQTFFNEPTRMIDSSNKT